MDAVTITVAPLRNVLMAMPTVATNTNMTSWKVFLKHSGRSPMLFFALPSSAISGVCAPVSVFREVGATIAAVFLVSETASSGAVLLSEVLAMVMLYQWSKMHPARRFPGRRDLKYERGVEE